MVCFNDKKLYEKAKLLRGWGRSSSLFNESEEISKRFNVKVDGIEYDSKYIFNDIGYNFLPSEISAAFALEQLKKLKSIVNKRISNFLLIKKFFKDYENFFKLPSQLSHVKTGWLAFPLVIKEKTGLKRKLKKKEI